MATINNGMERKAESDDDFTAHADGESRVQTKEKKYTHSKQSRVNHRSQY